MINLKALREEELLRFVQERGLPSYRARQLLHWIYRRGAESLDQITELPISLRESLRKDSYISNLQPLKRLTSSDGTEKFLFGLEDGERIESVLIPESPEEGKRITLCVSSQVGCALGCAFCLTGRMGLRRNLKAYEIVDQYISVRRLSQQKITNIVFMGMGEPLMNLKEVAEALRRITKLLEFSPRRITLSTAGVVPELRRLRDEKLGIPPVKIAISLNATTNSVRNRLMPINRRYPIEELLQACRDLPLKKRERITFEYVLIKGVNDSDEDARRLVRLLMGLPAKVNIIPFNSYSGSEFEPPEQEQVYRFQSILLHAGMTAPVRKSRGADILAACGQLQADYRVTK